MGVGLKLGAKDRAIAALRLSWMWQTGRGICLADRFNGFLYSISPSLEDIPKLTTLIPDSARASLCLLAATTQSRLIGALGSATQSLGLTVFLLVIYFHP